MRPPPTPRDRRAPSRAAGARARRRRRRLGIDAGLALVVALLSLAMVSTSGFLSAHRTDSWASTALYLDGLATGPDQAVTALPPGAAAEYLPGSRVPVPSPDTDVDEAAAAHAAAAAERDWLASGTVPGAGTQWEDMVTGALLDIHALQGGRGGSGAAESTAPGAVLAAWRTQWQYAWPRDTAFAAVALARTGHVGDAVAALDAVAEAQANSSMLSPRYLPDLSGPPDGRPPQSDGPGWLVWAAARTVETCAPAGSTPDSSTPDSSTSGSSSVQATPPDDGAAQAVTSPAATTSPPPATTLAGSASACVTLAESLRDVVVPNVQALLASTDTPTHLPAPSSDYWEMPEDRLTLGAVAPQWAGLLAAPEILRLIGEDDLADSAQARADEVGDAVEVAFGPVGWTRYSGFDLTAELRGVSGHDAATAFVLPPFTPAAPDGALTAWEGSATEMLRPAGGLAPGSSWRRDGISWTPQTTLYAWVAAENDRPDDAVAWLAWTDAHRTASGAIPEKVLADGSPAAVAPLAWSAANVVLAVLALEDRGELPGSIP
ncbi:glycoside hydrolase 15-related [Actinomycetales bacterium JB111]|nr:glycoside hydrolase 15-related [Actinomycetales bacterium JB111]